MVKAFVHGVGKSFGLGSHYRRTRFGSWGVPFYWLWMLDTHLVQEMHWNINRWTDKEAYAWKGSCLSSLNAVSVASAIFASVGLGALELPELETTHWLSRALLVTSMGLGVLAVIAATAVHKEVTCCTSALEIRLWLSRGVTRHRYRPPYDTMPLESSATTIKLLEAPNTLLYAATAMFLIGMGFYYLFQFATVDASPLSDNRAIFIFFTFAIGGTTAYMLSLVLMRKADVGQRDERFKLDRLALMGEKSNELRTLEAYMKWANIHRSHEGNDEALRQAHVAACAIIKQREDAYVQEYNLNCLDSLPLSSDVPGMKTNGNLNGHLP